MDREFVVQFNNYSVTENGALGYANTLEPLVDFNFKAAGFRLEDPKRIVKEFAKAFYADREYATKYLFFLRDIRGGLGERRTFRICLQYLIESHPDIALTVLELIPEYGRYDDLLVYIDSGLRGEACDYIRRQLEEDLVAMKNGKEVSLLAKWLPSNNTSSAESRRLARIIAQNLEMSPEKYRRVLKKLRSYVDVTEAKISRNKWNQVDYEKVPAKAGLKYDGAFSKHDEARRKEFFKKVLNGETKLKVTGLMPYEIVHRIFKQPMFIACKEDLLAELSWQKLIEEGYENEWNLQDCIVVADTSGSMMSLATGSNITAMEVCYSLAIYFAQILKGPFKDKVITFSERPKFIDLCKGKNLKEKLEIMKAYSEIANTNIEAVFDLILAEAIKKHCKQEELPKQVLIVSDMEFDAARADRKPMERLFETIERKYHEAGYKMPRLIFWNLCGRTETIPMVENEEGLCLLSGFSQNAIKVAADETKKDPYDALKQVLDGPRYEPIKKALQNLEMVIQ